jgi:hypothetical protein
MSELLREIEEDIRRERFEKLWRSIGRLMVGLSLGIVALTVVFVVAQDRNHQRANQKTSQLLKGIDRINLEDYKGAVPIFSSLTDDVSSPYYAIAMLQKANVQELSGDKEGAAKTYAALAEKKVDLAGVAKLRADVKDEGELSLTDPFYHSLAEARAWRLLSQDKKSEAVALFLTLSRDQFTPTSLKQRAYTVLQHIAPEALNTTQASTSAESTTKDTHAN